MQKIKCMESESCCILHTALEFYALAGHFQFSKSLCYHFNFFSTISIYDCDAFILGWKSFDNNKLNMIKKKCIVLFR